MSSILEPSAIKVAIIAPARAVDQIEDLTERFVAADGLHFAEDT
jgi:hypothetical protein